MFDVTVNGKPYQELHVDGGAFAQAFLYPPSLLRQHQERMRKKQQIVPAVAYIIRNGRFDSEWAQTERRTMGHGIPCDLDSDHGQRVQRQS